MNYSLLGKINDIITTLLLLVLSLYLSYVVLVIEPLTLSWYFILAFNVWVITLMVFIKSEHGDE